MLSVASRVRDFSATFHELISESSVSDESAVGEAKEREVCVIVTKS